MTFWSSLAIMRHQVADNDKRKCLRPFTSIFTVTVFTLNNQTDSPEQSLSGMLESAGWSESMLFAYKATLSTCHSEKMYDNVDNDLTNLNIKWVSPQMIKRTVPPLICILVPKIMNPGINQKFESHVWKIGSWRLLVKRACQVKMWLSIWRKWWPRTAWSGTSLFTYKIKRCINGGLNK